MQKQLIYNFDKMETLDFQQQLNRIEAAALGQKSVLNFNEACLFCGLSKSHMYKLTSNRQVPHYKPANKLVYFERLELEKWLLQNRVVSIAESEAKAINFCKTGGLR